MSAPLQQSNSQAKVEGAPIPPTTAMFLKKGFPGAKAGLGSIVSPTDNCLSPISAKLNNAKQRHFQKGKAVGLTSQLSSLATSSTASPSSGSDKKPHIDF